MDNARAAVFDEVRKSMKPIPAARGATTIDPKLLTFAERIQYEGYLPWEEMSGLVASLAADGIAIQEIVWRMGRSRRLVRQIVRGERTDVFLTGQESLDPHLPYLDAQWDANCLNGAELWRRLCAQGCGGSLPVAGEWGHAALTDRSSSRLRSFAGLRPQGPPPD